jgi:GTP-binding protein
MKVLRAELAVTASGPSDFPETGLPEVAFLGRSNVGKSSLLNRLVKRKALARTSSTPGKTRLLNFYRVESDAAALHLVDLPGYGFARVSRAERERWKRLVERYLEGRAPLRAAVLLQDLRRDWSEDESLLVAWLAERGVPVLVALTKIDKLKPMRRAERVRGLARDTGLPAERVVPTSAQTGAGVPELWSAIDALL